MSQTFTDAELASERWLPIARAPGYGVSDLGRVMSWLGKHPRIITPRSSSHYLTVDLRVNKRSVCVAVHRLVLEAFVGPRPDDLVTRHFPDRARTNNRLSNLSYGTPMDNAVDRVVHDTNRRGSLCTQAVLCESSVVLARWLRRDHKVNFRNLAEWFGVSAMAIHRAVIGKNWAHVSYGLDGAPAGHVGGDSSRHESCEATHASTYTSRSGTSLLGADGSDDFTGDACIGV